MSTATTLAERLEQADNSTAQSWVITELLLNAYPATIRQSVIAAAVPHWFTAEILAALLDLSMDEAEERYAVLQQLSIVQPFGDLGHALHDLTRSGILAYLASNAIDELRKYSRRVYAYLNNQPTAQDSQMKVESIYHQFIFTIHEGRSSLKTCAFAYRNEGNFAAVENLLWNYRELMELGLLEPADQVELERQEYWWTSEAIAKRNKQEKDEQLSVALVTERDNWSEQIDKKFSILIVDNEPYTRSLLHKILEAHDAVVVCHEAEDGLQALRLIDQQVYDIVFWDVNIHSPSGSNIGAELAMRQPALLVIFVTAHTDYAADAFDINVVDYVRKGSGEMRVYRALNKAIEQWKAEPKSQPVNEDMWLKTQNGNTYPVLDEIYR